MLPFHLELLPFLSPNFCTQLKIISQTFDLFKMVYSLTHNAVVASIVHN